MISLKAFIEKYKGKTVATPAGTFKGECVSLLQMYLYDCFREPYTSRGNANRFCTNLINYGLATRVDYKNIKVGDMVSFPAGYYNVCDAKYGHCAIYIGNGQYLQQNYGGKPTQVTNAYPPLSSSCVIARMKKSLVSEDSNDKTIDELAREVINGDWGNYPARKKELEAAGYDYNKVQARVNQLINGGSKTVKELAKEVINGNWGNGSARKKALESAGYDYDAVQAEVNRLLK